MAAKYSDFQSYHITHESDDNNEDLPEFNENREPPLSDVSTENILQEECRIGEKYGQGCYTCSSEIPVKNVQEIKPGKHLTRKGTKQNCGSFYNHHLLCTDIQYLPSNKALVTVIHKGSINEGGKEVIKVHKARIKLDLNSDQYNIVIYKNPRYTDDKIVQRAKKLLRKCEKKETCHKNGETTIGDYNLLLRNCEHFVTFCTTGHDESKQVYNIVSKCHQIYKKFSSYPIGNMMVTLMDYLDDVGNTLKGTKTVIGVGIALSILAFIWQVAKLIHTQCRKGLCTLCKSTKLRENSTDIILLLAEIGISVGFTVFFSLTFWQAISIGVGVALQPYFINPFIKKMMILSYPPIYITTNVSHISILEPGDIIEYNYWGLGHLGVIVDMQKNENKKQLSIIHYGLEKLLGTREIIEDKVMFPYSKPGLKKVEFLKGPHFEKKEVVLRAKSKLGEKKWNFVTNRSSHFCQWCKVKTIEEVIKIIQGTE